MNRIASWRCMKWMVYVLFTWQRYQVFKTPPYGKHKHFLFSLWSRLWSKQFKIIGNFTLVFLKIMFIPPIWMWLRTNEREYQCLVVHMSSILEVFVYSFHFTANKIHSAIFSTFVSQIAPAVSIKSLKLHFATWWICKLLIFPTVPFLRELRKNDRNQRLILHRFARPFLFPMFFLLLHIFYQKTNPKS